MAALTGKEEIVTYAKRSWKIIEIWIRTRAFPCRKLGGKWESDTKLIDDWKRDQITR